MGVRSGDVVASAATDLADAPDGDTGADADARDAAFLRGFAGACVTRLRHFVRRQTASRGQQRRAIIAAMAAAVAVPPCCACFGCARSRCCRTAAAARRMGRASGRELAQTTERRRKPAVPACTRRLAAIFRFSPIPHRAAEWVHKRARVRWGTKEVRATAPRRQAARGCAGRSCACTDTERELHAALFAACASTHSRRGCRSRARPMTSCRLLILSALVATAAPKPAGNTRGRHGRRGGARHGARRGGAGHGAA